MSRSRTSRIQRGYAARFHGLLSALHARRMERALGWLNVRAESVSKRSDLSLAAALAQLEQELRQKIAIFKRRHRQQGQTVADQQLNAGPKFTCDAGLGGLARWLRAAGYEASWEPDIDDSELIRKATRDSAILLTTDSMLMERRVLRDGTVRALWLPPTLKIHDQLALVLVDLDLPIRDPRCMNCGGELHAVEKEAVQDRIPPRTQRWLDQYWICQRCDQLFWRGTHWQKIRLRLERASV